MRLKRMWPVPKDLGVYGRALWQRAGKELVEAGSLEEMDREAFLTMCLCYDRMMQADAQMQREGLSVESGSGPGVKKKHPAFAIWKTSLDAYTTFIKQFGLTPQARGERIRPKEEAKEDGKAQFFD